jgi:hypothetical protein
MRNAKAADAVKGELAEGREKFEVRIMNYESAFARRYGATRGVGKVERSQKKLRR